MYRSALMWMGVAFLACLAAAASAADDDADGNLVWFQVDRTRAVENDRMTAMLGVNAEDEDPAELAKRVNEAMGWALERAKDSAGIEVRTGGYRTHPVQDRAKIRRWRARQDLILESADFVALGELIGALQTRLQMHSVNFSVSADQRRAVEDELVAEALAAYRARAEIVRRSLEASEYEIHELSIKTGGHAPPPVPLRAAAMAESVAPALKGGSSTLTVTAAGRIRLR